MDAGEQAGILETLLDKIATYKEKTEALKAKIKKALFYPTAVIVVAFIVTAILLIFVVPQFEEPVQGFGADLPAFTQMVVNLSELMQDYWWLMLDRRRGCRRYSSRAKDVRESSARVLDRVGLKVPVIGEIVTRPPLPAMRAHWPPCLPPVCHWSRPWTPSQVPRATWFILMAS